MVFSSITSMWLGNPARRRAVQASDRRARD
jgi:hypothetical protein